MQRGALANVPLETRQPGARVLIEAHHRFVRVDRLTQAQAQQRAAVADDGHVLAEPFGEVPLLRKRLHERADDARDVARVVRRRDVFGGAARRPVGFVASTAWFRAHGLPQHGAPVRRDGDGDLAPVLVVDGVPEHQPPRPGVRGGRLRELQRLGLPHDRVEGVQAVRVRQAAQRTPLILAQQLASAHIAAARAERVRPRGAGLGVAKGQALPILFVVVSPETQGAPGEIQAVVERRRGGSAQRGEPPRVLRPCMREPHAHIGDAVDGWCAEAMESADACS